MSVIDDNSHSDSLSALREFLARNPETSFSLAKLREPEFLESLDWSGADRVLVTERLQAIARLAALERDPERAHALLLAGYDSAHRILRTGASRFVADMQKAIGAKAAWSIYRRAEAVRHRVTHQWMQLREAVSPYARMLSTRTRQMSGEIGAPQAVAPGLSVNYKTIFGEAPFANVPHDASILGPGAYFTDLMTLIVERYHGQETLALSERRPDLWNILLTIENATAEVSQADLILEILESAAAGLLPSSFAALPQPWAPQGTPDVIQFLAAPQGSPTGSADWPSRFQEGVTYVLCSPTTIGIPVIHAGDALLSAPALSIDVSVTIRGAPGMQTITADAFELAIGLGSSEQRLVAPTVIFEDCTFAFANTARALALIRFSAGSLILRNCVFRGKGRLRDGWAIASILNIAGKVPGGTISIENCSFVDETSSSSACISISGSGPLTLSLSNSIIWPNPAPSNPAAAIKVPSATAVNVAYCDILGGKNNVVTSDSGGALPLNYADTNFDSDPKYWVPQQPAQPPYTRLQAGSPCIGRASDGGDVGASYDIYAALAWTIYPFELPCDLEMEAGALALAALDADLAQIDFLGKELGIVQNDLFPLSQLGLSLADYQIVSAPVGTYTALAGLYGVAAFADEAVTLSPASVGTAPWTFLARNFARRIGLSDDELRELIYQDLGPAEIAQGIQGGSVTAGLAGWKGFFINGAYEQQPGNVLALRTQYVPVGRYTFDFGGTTAAAAQVGFPALSIPDAFSITLWLYPDSAQTATILAIGSTLRLGLSIPQQSPSVTNLVFSWGSDSDQSISYDLSAFTANPAWLSLAVVFDAAGLTLTLYVNGEPLGAIPQEGLLPWPSSAMTLGNGLAGCICDLAIWKRALNAAEINSGFQRPVMEQIASTISPAPTGLVAYWPLNDGAGTLKIRDWTSPNPGGPNDGTLSKQVTWTAIGLPENGSTLAAAGQNVLQGGLAFVEAQLLTGASPASGPPGVTLVNLDCINRFVRLAQRLEWPFADLEWALFTLGQKDKKSALFANLARLGNLTTRLGLGVTQTCAMFGPLKPFGRGRLGDQESLFDNIYNRAPLAVAVFTPVMTLRLSLPKDFETPGPIARRLAAMLMLDSHQLTALVRRLAVNGIVTIDAGSLSALYRYRVLAGWIGLDVDGFLDLLDFTSLQGLESGVMPADLWDFVLSSAWITTGGLQPTELRYLTTSSDAAVDPAQQRIVLEFTEQLPKLVSVLAEGLAVWRVTPASFVTPAIPPEQSTLIYAAAVNAEYVDGNTGIVRAALLHQLPTAPYRVPSAAYATIDTAVQAAVGAFGPGVAAATVLIAPGYYTGSGNTGLAINIPTGCALTIHSEGGAAATVVDCGKLTSFLSVAGGGSLVVDGLTVQNALGAISSTIPLRVANCIFQKNQGYNGGAITITTAQAADRFFDADNCIFFKNTATNSAGAIYLGNTTPNITSSARIYYCTIYQNSAPASLPSGIFIDTGLTLSIDDSIVWDSPDTVQPDIGISGTLVHTFSDLKNVSGLTPQPDSTGSFSDDPKLLDPDNGFYGPKPDSRCYHGGEGKTNIGYGSITGSPALVALLTPFAYGQVAALERALTAFFGNNALPYSAVLSALGPYENGLEILTASGNSTKAVAYLRDVYRYLLLALRFDLDARLLGQIFASPGTFSLIGTGSTLYLPTPADLRTLARFAQLRKQYPYLRESLIEFLTSHANTSMSAGAADLAALFGWGPDAVAALSGKLPMGLGSVLLVTEAMGFLQTVGIDAPLFLSLYKNGLIFGADGAAPLVAALAAKDSDAADAVTIAITDMKRDLLKRFLIPQVDARTPREFAIKNDNDLSNYLLLDVKMTAQTTTSRVVQATLSLQEYVQRCRLGLEPGVGPGGLNDREWEWMSAYRTWEANRKVFLYPESYLRPDLRRDKTPLFVELERSLAGAAPTKDSLEQIYKRYLDQFQILATLETVGSWYEPSRTIDSAMTADSLQEPAYAIAATFADAKLYSTQLTVEAWIRTVPSLFDRGQENVLLQVVNTEQDGTDSIVSFSLTTEWVNGGNRLIFAVQSDSGAHASVGSDEILEPGVWYHVAGVFDGTTGKTHPAASLGLFIDGQEGDPKIGFHIHALAVKQGWFTVLGQNNGQLTPGSYNGFTNSLAEVRFWSTARTQEQILKNMYRQIPSWHPDIAQLCGYWTFENGSLADLTKNWNTLSLRGSVSFRSQPDLLTRVFREVERPAEYHFIGRTRTEPFRFYHRVKQVHPLLDAGAGGSVWQAWQPIELTLNARSASPVVVDGRLYLFWVETRFVNATSDPTGPVPAHHAVTIKYSWRNADGSWAAPQAPFPDVDLPGQIDLDSSPAWRRPIALPMSSRGATAILVMYGVSTSNSAPFCYILNWDCSVTRTALSTATLDDLAYSGLGSVVASTGPVPAYALDVFFGYSILGAYDMDARTLAESPPGTIGSTSVAACSFSFTVAGPNFTEPVAFSVPTTSAPGRGTFFQYGGAYWAPFLQSIGSAKVTGGPYFAGATEISVDSAALFRVGMTIAIEMINASLSTTIVDITANKLTIGSPVTPFQQVPQNAIVTGPNGLFFLVAADSRFPPAPLPSAQNALPVNYASSDTHMSVAVWNGAVYLAVASGIGTTTVDIFVADMDRLVGLRTWSYFAQLAIAKPNTNVPATVRLVVGDNNRLHCFYATADGVSTTSCDSRGSWSAPVSVMTNDAGIQGMLLSEIVFWKNMWWTVTCDNAGKVFGWRVPSLDKLWTKQTQVASVTTGPQYQAPSLSANFAHLICMCPNFQASSNSYNWAAYFADAPDAVGWQSLQSEASMRPSLIFARFRGRTGPLLLQLLGAVAQDAWAGGAGNQLAAFTFDSDGAEFLVQARVVSSQVGTGNLMDSQVTASLNADGTVSLGVLTAAPDLRNADFSFERLTSTGVPTLAKALALDGIDGLLSDATQQAQERAFGDFDPAGTVLAPADDNTVHFERTHPLGLYYREIFLFIPWLIANQLTRSRRFAEARAFLEYIFKPSAAAGGEDYWRCVWFKDVSPVSSLAALENLDPAALAFYREDPFNATAIADLRLSSYQRAIVIAYVRNLIAWGDDLFSQNTRETINQADQYYRHASDLLGPKPKRVAYTPPPPETYRQLTAQAENSFLISLEPIGAEHGTTAPAPLPEGQDPNGSIIDLGVYFGVPDSPEFLGNWDIVEDRLYKIRNGLTLSGAQNQLPLFEPPLTLDQIQRRAAGGALAASALAGAAGPTDQPLLFPEILLSARMIANTVVEFGTSLLRVLEAQDAEALAELQAAQQSALADRLQEMRSEEVNIAVSGLDALNAQLSAAQYRRDFYKGLIADSLSPKEQTALDMTDISIGLRTASTVLTAAAAVLFPFPTVFGLANGGGSIAQSVQTIAEEYGTAATVLGERSALVNSKAAYERRAQEWELQQRLAEYDVTQLEAQIKSAQRQKNAAEMQYRIEATSQRNTRAVEDYYRSKFTNADLYGWMAETLGQLHAQLYQVALGIAQMAQTVLAAHSGTDQTYISPAGWNAQRRGLLAGESLLLDLARMEQAYLQAEGVMPMQKVIPLSAVNPHALLQLVRTGSCDFDLSEELFDRDHPGQYLRNLRAISVKLRGLTQGKEGVNAALTRISHAVVRQPDADTVRFLLGAPESKPGKALVRGLQPRHVAVSHAPVVAGAAQAEFHSGDIEAFAGGGAVSRWRLEIPPGANRVDLSSITDVELTVRFTARHGGDGFRRDVEQALPPYRARLLIDAARDFPAQWKATAANGQQPLPLPVDRGRLPRNLAGRVFQPRAVLIQAVPSEGSGPDTMDVSLSIPQSAAAQRLHLQQVDGVLRGSMDLSASAHDLWKDPWTLQLGAGSTEARLSNLHMIVEFDEI